MFAEIFGPGDELSPDERLRISQALMQLLASDLTPEQLALVEEAAARIFSEDRQLAA